MSITSSMKRIACVGSIALAVMVTGCKKEDGKAGGTAAAGGAKPRQVHKAPDGAVIKIAFVTNNPSPFWTLASNGTKKYVAEATARGEKVIVDVKMPQNGSVAEQNTILEDLLAQGYHGIAISVIAPEPQTPEVNRAAKKTNLVTHDSDAAGSNRLVYIGTNNYEAGKKLGEQILAMNLLPDGGKAVPFVGFMSADNARERLRGISDALKGSKIEILQAKEDSKNNNTALTNVEAVLQQPDVKLLIGLWAYNGTFIGDALGGSPRKADVKAVAFDEEDGTLNAIDKGLIACTVVQKPYQFGYQSAKLLHELAVKGESALPKEDAIDTGVRVITAGATTDKTQNVAEFRTELAEQKK